MPLGQYLTGVAFFVPTFGAALGVGWLITRRQYRFEPPVVRALACMVLATAALVFAHVVPAALGILTRGTVLATALLLLLAASRVPDGPGTTVGSAPSPSAPPRVTSPSLVIAGVTVLVVTVYELARLRGLISRPLTDIDMLGFHLPGVARFIQTGSLWQVDQFLPGFATAQYPNNGDFLLLAAALPWHDLAFVRLVPLPFYAFTGIGTYAIALELRAPRAAAATLAAAVITVPALSLLALDGLPDSVSLATLAAGIVFLIRHARSQRTSELVLAGLALGLSFGTKWYGLTSVAVLCVVWLLARLIYRRERPALLHDSGVLAAMMFLGGGIWLVRNLIESANPIYPKAVSLFGVQLFAGSRGDVIDRSGYTIAQYLGQPHILSAYIYPGFRQRVGVIGVVVLVGLVAAVALAFRGMRTAREGTGQRLVVIAMAGVALGICAMYVLTPGSAYGLRNLPTEGFVNIRWLMPAIMLAAALTARAAGELPRAGWVLELGALAGALDGIRLGPTVDGSTVIKLVAEMALVCGAVLFAGRARMASPGAGCRRLPAAPFVAAGVGALVVLLAAGRLLERYFDKRSYAGYDATFAWIDAHAADHRRIGIVGIATTDGLSPVLPAFGPRLGNHVSYIGVRARHSLHVFTSEPAFRAQLRRGRYDLVLIGLQDPGHADAWTAASGYRLVARSDRLALYAARSAR